MHALLWLLLLPCGTPAASRAAHRCKLPSALAPHAAQRDRRVLEKQSRAILKMPTKQSKEEVAAVEVRPAVVCCAGWQWCQAAQRAWLERRRAALASALPVRSLAPIHH